MNTKHTPGPWSVEKDMNRISEGTRSAQRINNSLTGDPLLLHRVDASLLEAPVHENMGICESERQDEDRGMEMLAGVLITLALVCIVMAILTLGGVFK